MIEGSPTYAASFRVLSSNLFAYMQNPIHCFAREKNKLSNVAFSSSNGEGKRVFFILLLLSNHPSCFRHRKLGNQDGVNVVIEYVEFRVLFVIF